MGQDNRMSKDCWIPDAKSSKGMQFITIFLALGLVGGILIGYLIGGISITPRFNPTIDGIIRTDEYESANYRIGQYFDVNNTNGDSDGLNYFYLGQDTNNVYIAVDLVSDTTNSTSNEWFSIFMNTNNQTFENFDEFYSQRNNGTENFVYDVQDEAIKPYASGIVENENEWIRNDTSYSSVNLEYGEQLGDWDATENINGSVDLINSAINGFSNEIKLNFQFDIVDYLDILPEYKDQLLSSITNAKIDISSFLSIGFFAIIDNSDISYSKVNIDNNGTYNDAPLNFDTTPIPTYSFPQSYMDRTYLDVNSSAFSSGVLSFSITVYNATSYAISEFFDLWIDYCHLSFDISQSDAIYGTSSIINNYEVAVGFGISPNSAIPHRMYEFKVAKSELENYTSDGTLGVYITGSGMTFELGNNYYFGVGEQGRVFWVFWFWDNNNPDWSVNYYYLPMNKYDH